MTAARRRLGPALVSGDLYACWIYIAAPVAGATLEAEIYQFLRSQPQN